MYNIYMDSGTSNTRAYLVEEFTLIDSVSIHVGTKDSAILGNNSILLDAMKSCYDQLLENNHLKDIDVTGVWFSGMVTNTFGIIEVEHVSTPVDGSKLLNNIYVHHEDDYFKRNINLIRGVKTAQPGEEITLENIGEMNNVRGEEIEVVGMVATGILPKNMDCVMISPGSHTHLCHVKNGVLEDIVSNFTGELNFALIESTILGGELSKDEIKMDPEYVNLGYRYLQQYGISRALYMIHATKVFDTCTDEIRSQILSGIISGSVVELLSSKITHHWKNVEKIIIIGSKSYVQSYRILCELIISHISAEVVYSNEGKSFALSGFLELLRLTI